MNFQELKSLFFSAVKWSQKQLINGMLIEYDGDQIGKASIIYQVSPDGLKSPLPDGEYKTKEGVLFILKDGKVSSVESPATVAQPSNEPIKQAQAAQTKEPYGNVEYADDKNKKYPIDTEEHIRAAWNYINKEKDAAEYSADDLQKVKERIISAWKSKIDPKGPPSAEQSTKQSTMSDKNKTEQVKASDEEMKKQPDATATAEDAEDTQETADYQKILAEALAPIAEALKSIQASLGATSTMAEETKAELSKIKPVVEKLANEPASEKKETKKPLNPFNSNKGFDEDITTSKTYGVLKAGAQTKK